MMSPGQAKYNRKWYRSSHNGFRVHHGTDKNIPLRTIEEIRATLGLLDREREEPMRGKPVFLVPRGLLGYLKL